MFKKTLLVRALAASFGAAAIAVATSPVAYAQQSTGSISGRASQGDVVTAENKSINVSRQITLTADGTWQLTQLPAGEYVVTVKRVDGTTQNMTIQVTSGQGAFAAFPVGLERVVVVGSAVRTIDVTSSTSSFTLSKDEIDRIPVAQDVTSVVMLTPGATQGDGRIGTSGTRAANLASLGGASVAENAYYINGFNVTNIVKGIAFNAVPFEATAEQQVKNGGYSVEYGRSLGGVISVNTKRGTDEWKGGISLSYSPKALRGKSVYADKSATTGNWNLVERPGDSESALLNLYVGGPLIKDTLYGFALIQGGTGTTNTFGESNQQNSKTDTPQYLVKLDWNVNKNNLFELTAFSDKSTEKVNNYSAVTPYGAERGAYTGTDKYTTGGQNIIGKWTSYLTSNFTVSALAGVGKYSRANTISASGCPAVYDGRGGSLVYMGCWSEAASIVIDDPQANDKRTAYRLDAEWVLGKHTLRAGLDNEVYDTLDGSTYTGGYYDRLFTLAPGSTIGGTGYVNNTGAPQDYIRERVYAAGGTFQTKNSAWYLEDTFQATKNIVLNLGVRNESFENLNDKGKPFVTVKNTWAPRGGAAWDVKGDGQTKLYANAGRYYIPVYANTNVRLSGAETFYTDYFAFDGTFSTDGQSIPGHGPQLGSRVTTSDGAAKDPRTVVDPNLKPMHQDELIVGFQQALANRWAVGVKYTHRNLAKVMDDICEGKLAGEWALANGYTAGQAANIDGTIAGCFLYNPGDDLVANVDLNDDGNLTPVRIPASALLMPKPKRTYDAFEFMVERQWDKKWSFQGSYVLAYSKGNTEGYVKSDNGQDDAGITQDFDHPGLMVGSEGYLPNDRRHTIKLNGSYGLNDEWRVGAALLIQSGRPKNCFGNYPSPAEDPGTGAPYTGTIEDDSPLYGAASFYCNNKLNPRGTLGRTPWIRNLNLQATYTPNWKKGLTFNVNVLNVFNERGVRGVQEAGELDAVGSVNGDYNRPLLGSVQSARSVRLTAAYEF